MVTELSPDKILERIQKRLAATGKSERGAAEEAGLSASAIRNIREGKSQSPRLDTIYKLAPVLQTTFEWLALGKGAETVEGAEAPPPAEPPWRSDELIETASKFILASHGGTVEAGAFRPVDEFSDDAPRPRSLPRDPDYPYAEVVTFDVGGDSMNALKPRPILPGDDLVCMNFESLRGRVPLRDGMVVIVEQTLQGGHLRERSVKQVEIYEDRVEFHPRSTNPKHKPIVVPWKMFSGEEEEDGRRVEVLAIVRSIFNMLPLS